MKITAVCGGCSAEVNMTRTPCGDWGTCPRCGGLIGENVTHEGYCATMSGAWVSSTFKGTGRYFDIYLRECPTYPARRSHGWYDPRTGDLVQAG